MLPVFGRHLFDFITMNFIFIEKDSVGLSVFLNQSLNADKGEKSKKVFVESTNSNAIYFNCKVGKNG